MTSRYSAKEIDALLEVLERHNVRFCKMGELEVHMEKPVTKEELEDIYQTGDRNFRRIENTLSPNYGGFARSDDKQ